MKKTLVSIVLGATQMLYAQNADPVMVLNKTIYQPGEKITINAQNFPNDGSQWMCHVRKGGNITAGQGRLDWTSYIYGNYTWETTANTPGEYQIVRVAGSYSGGYSVHAVADFRVGHVQNESSFIQWETKIPKGFPSIINGSITSLYAEDFEFSVPTKIKKIQLHGFVKNPSFNAIQFYIFEDNGNNTPNGTPEHGHKLAEGVLPLSSPALSFHKSNNLGGNGDRYYITIDMEKALSKPLHAQANKKYWIAVGVPTSSSQNGWYWQQVKDGKLSSANWYRNGFWSSTASHFSFSVEGSQIDQLHTSETHHSSDDTATIYPNPSQGIFHLHTTKTVKNIRVFDASGKNIPTEIKDHQILMTNAPIGVYYIKIEYTDGSTATQKVIRK